MQELSGKVAVVTGAAGGIGSALARRLGDEGCTLVLIDRAGEALDALAREVGGDAVAMDVRDAAAWAALAERLERDQGGVDLLVNNAGLTIHGTFLDHTLDEIHRIVDVNLKGVLLGCRALVPQLVARGAGHVVNVSSLAGRLAFPYQSTSATKYAVRGFGASAWSSRRAASA